MPVLTKEQLRQYFITRWPQSTESEFLDLIDSLAALSGDNEFYGKNYFFDNAQFYNNISLNDTNITGVNTLCATEIHSLSSFTRYQDIIISEISGFNATGTINISGDINVAQNGTVGGDLTIDGKLYSDDQAIITNELSAKQFIALDRGSMASNAFTFDSDLGTGVYSPTSAEIAISTNSIERIIIKPDGLVGIGTSTPNENLTIVGNTSTKDILFANDSIIHNSITSPNITANYIKVNQIDITNLEIEGYTVDGDLIVNDCVITDCISAQSGDINITGKTLETTGSDILITAGNSLSAFGGDINLNVGNGLSGAGTITLSGDTTIYDDLTVTNSITSPNISANYIKVNQIDITNLEIEGYTVDGDLIVNDCVITDCISAQSGNINITGKTFDTDGSDILITAGNSLSAFGGDINLNVGNGLSGAGTITLSGDTTIYDDLTVTNSITTPNISADYINASQINLTNSITSPNISADYIKVNQIDITNLEIEGYTVDGDLTVNDCVITDCISAQSGNINITGKTFDTDGSGILITAGNSLSAFGGDLFLNVGTGLSGAGTITLSGDTTIYDDLTVTNSITSPNIDADYINASQINLTNSITSPNISADYIKVNQIDITNLEIEGYTVDGDLIVNNCVITDCISAQSGDINITGKTFDTDGSDILITAGDSLSAFGGDINLNVGNGLSGNGSITLNGDTLINSNLEVSNNIKTATLNVVNRVDLSIAGTGDGMYLTDLDSDGGLTMLTITDRSEVGNTILDINRVPQVPDPRPTIDEYTFTQDYVDFHGNFLLNSPISSTLAAIRIDGATFPDMDGGDIIITGGHSLSSYGGNLLFTAGSGISGDGTITLSGDTTIYDDLTVTNSITSPNISADYINASQINLTNSITSPNISADYIKVNQIDITNLEIAGYTVDGDLTVNDCVITDCISAQSGDINITGKTFDTDGSDILITAGNSLSAFGGNVKLTAGGGLSGAGTITLSGDTTIFSNSPYQYYNYINLNNNSISLNNFADNDGNIGGRIQLDNNNFIFEGGEEGISLPSKQQMKFFWDNSATEEDPGFYIQTADVGAGRAELKAYSDNWKFNNNVIVNNNTITNNLKALGGDLKITGYNTSVVGDAGNIEITAGSANDGNGGNITITAGTGTSESFNGSVYINAKDNLTVNALKTVLRTTNVDLTGTLDIGPNLNISSFSKINSIGISSINVSPSATASAAFYDVVIQHGANIRASNITIIWHDGNVTFSETATTDIGTTDAVMLSAGLMQGDIALISIISDSNPWTIKGYKKLV